MWHTSLDVFTLLGFRKDLSKEKAGSVSELPPKQGGLRQDPSCTSKCAE